MYGHDGSDFFWRPRLGYYSNPSQNGKLWVIGEHSDRIEATSYGWWTFVKQIDGKVVFNNYHYSSETSSHQHGAREILKKLRIKVDVEVSTRKSLSEYHSLSQFLPELYTDLFANEAQAKFRPRKNASQNKYWFTKPIASLKKQIKILRKSGAKFPRKQIAEAKAKAIKFEVDRAETIKKNRIEARQRVAAGRAILKNSWKNQGDKNANQTQVA